MFRLGIARDTAKPIDLNVGQLDAATLLAAAERVNEQLEGSRSKNLELLDIYDVIDLRMLSGLVGELFSAIVEQLDDRLIKNPNLDGYPDLCDVSNLSSPPSPDSFLHFAGGGIEVKNTFGLQRTTDPIPLRGERSARVQPRLVWKAHHQFTNRLLALQSDYIDGIPQVIAAFFADDLVPDDWTIKQQPKTGSTMTSFCATKASAFEKLKRGAILLPEED